MSDRADAILPVAAELVCGVIDRDRDQIAATLQSLDRNELYALAVVLAAHVPESCRLGRGRELTPGQQVATAVSEAAGRFACTDAAVLGRSRAPRNVIDARAVAMAALRYLGHSSPFIGERFARDHTTVLYAEGRVGEDARLRRIARDIADQIGSRGQLDIKDDQEEVA